MSSIHNQRLNAFEPRRLVQARLAKKWSQPELADRVAITRQAISSYEKQSGSKPSPENLHKLAKWLEVPEAFFFTPLRESENMLASAINFRTLKSNKRKARFQAECYMQWLISYYDFVAEYIVLPTVDIPDFKIDDFLALSLEDVEDIAEETRRYFGLGEGPISNLSLLLENKGVVIGRVPLEPGMDAISASYNSRPVILINKSAYYARSRFDLAHELFHIIAHRDATFEDLEDKKIHKTIEEQAQRFAGAFLAPRKTFLPEVYRIDKPALIDLKKRWGISAQAIIMRLYDQGVISEHQKTRFFTRVNAEGWRRKEPLDGETPAEEATFLYKAANFLDENNILDLNEFVVRCRMPEWFTEHFVEIPKTYHKRENVISFQPKRG